MIVARRCKAKTAAGERQRASRRLEREDHHSSCTSRMRAEALSGYPSSPRFLQTGTGTFQTTAISTAAITAAIFNLVDRSMASSDAMPTSALPYTRPLLVTL
jgi:hypothetical protein